MRAVRWKVILERIHPNVRTGNLFAGVMIGYFMNNLIPRSGELVRPWFTAQEEKDTTYSSLLGSIIVERFIDTVALLIMIAVILLVDHRITSYNVCYTKLLRSISPCRKDPPSAASPTVS